MSKPKSKLLVTKESIRDLNVRTNVRTGATITTTGPLSIPLTDPPHTRFVSLCHTQGPLCKTA
jgi:hypothetical protein